MFIYACKGILCGIKGRTCDVDVLHFFGGGCKICGLFHVCADPENVFPISQGYNKSQKDTFTWQITVKSLMVQGKFQSQLKDYTYAFYKERKWLNKMWSATMFMG